ncbi:unnamed protein product, partial [Mesorhabditis belari]|uniref:DUF7778 domain-containing protein n=1 Tax=Mesorhabditis belari TaxID=2138241 RepID=A0AAF3FPA1_9BILA
MANRPLRPLKSSPIPPPIIPSSTPAPTYAASNTFDKKLVLPDRDRWRVPVEDVYLEGQLVIYVKTKSLLWESYSNVKTRPLTLTRRGFLVIYMKGNKGYIIDVGAAKSIESVTDKRGANPYYRTHIKLRYSFGNVHLWGFHENGLDWKLAVQKAFERSIPPYRSPITSTPKRVILSPPQTDNAITPRGNDEKNEETEMLSAAEYLAKMADVVESEYLAPELRPITQTESAVTWMSLTDVINEQEEEEANQESPYKKTTDFQDAATNIPSDTHMQRVRRFLRKSLPTVDRSFSAPHMTVEEKPAKQQSRTKPAKQQSPMKPADLNTSANQENEQKSFMPKHNVAEICAKLEKTLSTRQPSREKKGFYRWIKKTTRSPEKKAQIEMKESMTSMVGYEKSLGWERPMIGTESETNV